MVLDFLRDPDQHDFSNSWKDVWRSSSEWVSQ
jgi:hypothetical protein